MIEVTPTSRLVFDLEIPQIDYNEQKKESLRQEISKKYGVPVSNVEINFVPVTVNENGEKLTLTNSVIKDIQDPNFQQKLFKEYIEGKGMEVSQEEFDEIITIDNMINGYVDFDSYSKFRTYKVKYLKWKNYLSYGNDNYIDLTSLHGLVLLTGQPENTSGKTTLAIDLLRFALFGRAQKSPTLESVFNTFLDKETEVVVETCIEIGGQDYVIRRTITRPALSRRTDKSKPKQAIEYFKLVNGNYEDIVSENGASTTETQNIIKESIGTVEDFDLVMSATAYTLGDLLRMGQTDKSKLFSRWLGLLTLEIKEQRAKEVWKNYAKTLLSNTNNKAKCEEDKGEYKKLIDHDNEEITKLEKNLVECDKKLKEYNKQKNSVLSSKKQINETLSKIDLETVDKHIEQQKESLSVLRAKQEKNKERYFQIKDVKFDGDEHVKLMGQNRTIMVENGQLRTEIKLLKDENKRIEQLIAEQTCPTCKQHIDSALQGNFIAENKKKIDELISKGVANKKNLEEIEKRIKQLEEIRQTENELNCLKPQMSAIKVQIDNAKLQIEHFEKQRQEVEANKENIKLNNDIDAKIMVMDESIRTENAIRDECIRAIENYKSEVKTTQARISDLDKLIEEIEKEEKTIRIWGIYQELVGKNGIIKLVLKKALPIVNGEISRLLDGLCDFEVKLSVDDNNKVCLDLLRDGKSMDLGIAASGWESCISSIALRSALANLISLPRCNFTVYDEVLSGVSSENMENVFKLFRRVVNNYDFIFHICHDSSLSDYHDQMVTVVKEENISKINVGKYHEVC